MTLGPGKYDDICTEVRKRLGARGVILVVLDGAHGHGGSTQFAACLTPYVLTKVPALLRALADSLEEDVRNMLGPRGGSA